MATNPPDEPKTPGILDSVDSAMSSTRELTDAISPFTGGQDPVTRIVDGVTNELESGLTALGIGKGILKYNVVSSVTKALRGGLGAIFAPFVGAAAGFAGISPGKTDDLLKLVNDGVPFSKAWFQRLQDKWKELKSDVKPFSQEPFTRIFFGLSGLLYNGTWSAAKIALKDGFGAIGTFFAGFPLLRRELKKMQSYDYVNSLIPVDRALAIAEGVGTAVKMIENHINYTSNIGGNLKAFLARLPLPISPETRERWMQLGDAAARFLGGTGSKEELTSKVKDVATDTAMELARRRGIAENDLKRIQDYGKMVQRGYERMQKGEYLEAATDVFQTFGFDTQKITRGIDLQKVATQVKSIFTQAMTGFETLKKYQDGVDFQTLNVPVTQLLPFHGEALTKFQNGIKEKLGQAGAQALQETFQTIRTQGPKMINAAKDFVANLEKAKPELAGKMGYTLAAENMEEAMRALLEQRATPDFIAKIHTFNLVDTAGQKLSSMATEQLEAFKQKVIEAAKKLPQHPAPDAERAPAPPSA